MRRMKVWVESSEAWREIKIGSDGQPRYVSNGALVGVSPCRVTQVTEENQPPTAGDVNFPEAEGNG